MSRPDAPEPGAFIIIKDDPFDARPPRLIARERGRFVSDFVDMADFEEVDRGLARAFVDGEEVPAELWQRTPPGRFTEIVIAPAGDGDKILRTVLTLAVVAASFYIGGAAAGALGFQAGTAAYTAASALTAGVVSTLGNLAINAILPPPKLSGNYADQPDPVYFINGARNQLVLNQPLQTVLGVHRFVPRLAGRPYPEIRGDDSYYYVILDLGPIGVEIEDIKVGDTPIGEIDGTVAQWRLKASDPVPSMASRQVISEAVGANLGAGDWETRRTASDAVDCDLILFFPQGLGTINDKGKPRSHTVQVRVRYRKVINPGPGETFGDWQFAGAAPAGGIPFRGFDDFDTLEPTPLAPASGLFTYTRAQPGQPFYRSPGFSFPEAGTWEVSVQRVGADGEVTDRIYDDVRFETLLSKRDGAPVLRDDVSWGVIRFKGSEETSSAIDTVNMVLKRLVPVFPDAVLDQADLSGVTEADLAAPAVSSRPAEIILWMARNGFEGRRPWGDGEINWPDLARFAKDNRDRGRTFNHVVQNDVDLGDLIELAAFAGEGRAFRYNGRLCIEADRPQPAPTHFFREGTARAIRFTIGYPQPVHGFRVTFNDAADGWREREVVIYVGGYTKETATRIEPFALAGKTDWTDLHECLQQQYRNAQLQTVTARLEVPVESVDNSLRKMSWVSVATRVLAQARDSGVIRAVTESAGAAVSVKLDQPIEQGPGTGPLALRWVRKGEDGALTFSEVVLALESPVSDEVSEIVTFADPVTGGAKPQAGDEFIIGPSSVDVFEGLLDTAEQAGKDWLRLTLKAYAPARFDDTGFSVPDHVPAYDLPFDPAPPQPVLAFTRADEQRITVGFTLADGFAARIDHFRVWRAEAAAAEDPNPSALGAFRKLPDLPGDARQLTDDSLTAGDRVAYRIQAVSRTGRAGALLQTGIITAADAIGEPAGIAITPFTETGDGGAEKPRFRITFTPDPRDALANLVVSIRKVARDSEGARLAEGSQPAFDQVALLDPAAGRGEIGAPAADTLYDFELYYRGRRKEQGDPVRVLDIRSSARDVAGVARGAEGPLADAIADTETAIAAAQQAISDVDADAQAAIAAAQQALANAAANLTAIGAVDDKADEALADAQQAIADTAANLSALTALGGALDDAEVDISEALARGQNALNATAANEARLDLIDGPGGHIDQLEQADLTQATRIEAVRFASPAPPPGLRSGAAGTVVFEANKIADGTANAGEIRTLAGYIDHPTAGRVNIPLGYFQTPWEGGDGARPADGLFYVIFDPVNDLQTRFPACNFPANVKFFTAQYNASTRVFTAHANGIGAESQTFVPAPTDICLAIGTKRTGETQISSLVSLLQSNAVVSSSVIALQEATNDLATDYTALNLTVQDQQGQIDGKASAADLTQLGEDVDDLGNTVGLQGTAISDLSVSLADLEDAVDLKASITYVDDVEASLNGSIASTATSIRASFAPSLPNLLPAQYQIIDRDNWSQIDIVRAYAEVSTTGLLNKYSGNSAINFRGTQDQTSFRLDIGKNDKDIVLEPGHVYLFGMRWYLFPLTDHPNARVALRLVRVSDNAIVATSTGQAGTGGYTESTFSLSLVGQTESRYYLQVLVYNLTAAEADHISLWIDGLSAIRKVGDVTSAVPLNVAGAAQDKKLRATEAEVKSLITTNADDLSALVSTYNLRVAEVDGALAGKASQTDFLALETIVSDQGDAITSTAEDLDTLSVTVGQQGTSLGTLSGTVSGHTTAIANLGTGKVSVSDYNAFTAATDDTLADYATLITANASAATSNASRTGKLEARFGRVIPHDFANLNDEWTNSIAGSAVGSPANTLWSPDGQSVKTAYLNGTFKYLMTRALMPNIVGQRYRIAIRYQIIGSSDSAGTNAVSVFFRGLDSAFQSTANVYGFETATYDGTEDVRTLVSGEFEGDAVVPFLRPGWYTQGGMSSGELRVLSFNIIGSNSGYAEAVERIETTADDLSALVNAYNLRVAEVDGELAGKASQTDYLALETVVSDQGDAITSTAEELDTLSVTVGNQGTTLGTLSGTVAGHTTAIADLDSGALPHRVGPPALLARRFPRSGVHAATSTQ